MQIDTGSGGIVYPGQGPYRVLGRDREGIRGAGESALGGRGFLPSYSKVSATGKYHSWRLDLVVGDENERHHLFGQRQDHPAVLMVIG